MKSKFDKYINVSLILFILSTIGLVIVEVQSPGYCPTYPFLNIPGCFVILTYFIIMFLAMQMKGKFGSLLFYIFGVIVFFSSVYFSYNEVMNLGHCPQAFTIPLPLCFTVFPTMALLLFWKLRADKIGYSTSPDAVEEYQSGKESKEKSE